jgi:hypothetical protein
MNKNLPEVVYKQWYLKTNQNQTQNYSDEDNREENGEVLNSKSEVQGAGWELGCRMAHSTGYLPSHHSSPFLIPELQFVQLATIPNLRRMEASRLNQEIQFCSFVFLCQHPCFILCDISKTGKFYSCYHA